MEIFFDALGTTWHITVESAASNEKLREVLMAKTAAFEKRFSRFVDSEVTQFRAAAAGTYPISKELTKLLQYADQLRSLTGGIFDPGIATLLESAGYAANYQLQPDEKLIRQWKLPEWSLNATAKTVTIDGPIVFDLGGFGKGYWIDQLAGELSKQGSMHWIVEGGGDMVASTKSSGESYHIALEYPGRAGMAIGTVELKNQGLAVSDTFKRRWGKWHHLVNGSTKQPVSQIRGVITLAENALIADMMTSAIALSDRRTYTEIGQKLQGEYLVILSDNQVIMSSGWPGEVFSA